MSDDARADGVWGPSGGLVGLAWVAAAAAAAWCVLLVATGADPPGLLLASTATLGLGLAALYGTRARPRLRVDASGLVVRGLVGSRHHPWVRVDDVRVLAVRRLGRESTLLEIDVTEPDGRERMMIFGRLELDDDPADVAEAIHAIRPGR